MSACFFNFIENLWNLKKIKNGQKGKNFLSEFKILKEIIEKT